MRNERTTELIMCPHNVLRLRINGEPLQTALIDREEARALIRELTEWLDGEEIEELAGEAAQYSHRNNLDVPATTCGAFVASNTAIGDMSVYHRLLALTRTHDFVARYEAKLAALKGGK